MRHFRISLLLLVFCSTCSTFYAQRLAVGFNFGKSYPKPILEWQGVTLRSASTSSDSLQKNLQFGVHAKLKVFQELYLRGELYFTKSNSLLNTDYEVNGTIWHTSAWLSQNTTNLIIAPELHFLPDGFGYVFGGLIYEINSKSDFSFGEIVKPLQSGIEVLPFQDETANNTRTPGYVLGLGLNPHFGRIGVFAEARYSRTVPSAVLSIIPKVGQANFAIVLGANYKLL